MAIAPMVARLVIITLNAGNRRAELSARPAISDVLGRVVHEHVVQGSEVLG